MKKPLQLLVGCSVSAVMLFLAFRDLNIAQLKEDITQLSLWPVVPFIGLVFAQFIARAYRWRLLLPAPQGEVVGIRKLFDSMMVGNLATFILPLRLGEFIRPLMLARLSEYSFASSFISVVIERFFDLSAVLISFAIVIPLLPELPPWATLAAYSLGVVAIALLLFLVFGCLFPNLIRGLVGTLVTPLPERLGGFIKKFAGDLLEGASVIKTPSRLTGIVTLTALVWITSFLQFYVLLFMFPHEQQSLLLGVTLCVFVSLAVALPSAPGFVGVFQMGCVAAAALFAYSVSAAQLYSILVHLLTFILVIALGVWVLTTRNLNLFELKKAAEKDA